MSHNYPYRRPPSDTDLRSEAGPYRSAGRRHASPDHDFYRPPQESFSSSYPSSSSSRGLTSAQCSQDGALSILSSCGLEPSDLALLAELPEDVLTVESLPQVLAQIKGKRGTIRSFPTNSLSAPSSSSSYHRLAVSSSPSDRDHLSSRPIQYPIDQVTLSPLLSEHDCWGNPRTSLSVRAHPTPSSTSRYVVDFQHRPGPPEYGKIVRATGPVSSQELPSFSSAGQGKRTYPAQFSEPRSADYRTSPPPDEYHPKPRGGHRESQTSSIRSSSREAAAVSMPSEKKALDFHGTCPTVFPYSCSLCDITVLSEKVWIKHINGTQHAEGQLTLLQQFSNWDCRLESLSRPNNQSENRKDEEKTSHSSQTHKPQPNIKPENKASEKSKVVCVRFPPQSVDETYLRKLTEPFGNIVKILMFPSLAFVELGSIDQAKDLVTFHINYPPTVNGEKIEFRISNTFNFFQSSRVVSFTPVPKGEDGKSDLISIVKRFGPVLYTLFLPSMAFLEMKNASDAQKLINHYCSNTLRIKNDFIKVGFSGEHKTLMGVPSAKRYEEETFSTKRSRSLSREKDNSRKRKRSSSKDQEGQNKKTSRERRSRDESNKQKKTRSRSREKIREKSSRETRSRSKSRPRERSSKESKNRRSRSRERSSKESKNRRSRSREKSSREKRTNTKSGSSDKSSGKSSRQSSSRQKAVEETTPETKSRTKGEQTPLAEAAEKPQIDEKAALSAGESEIEGMEVIGEDGENVEEDTDGKEEEVKENKSQAERTDTDKVKDRNEEEEDLVCEMKVDDSETRRETKKATKTQLEDDKEPDSSVDLNNCITLDELEDHQSDCGGEHNKDDAKAPSIRVIYFKNLPMSSYTDVEFLRLVKDFGKAVRYLIIRKRKEGFIEMSSSSEAQKAAKVLRCKRITFKGYKVNARMSHKYYRLINGLDIPPNPDNEKRSQSQSSSRRKSERQSKSKTSDRDEISEVKEPSKRTPEKESGSKTSTEKKPDKDSAQNKTEEKDLKTSSKTESNGRKSPDKESGSKTSTKKKSDKDSAQNKTQEKDHKTSSKKESNGRKSPEKESGSKTSTEKKSDKDSAQNKTEEKDLKTSSKTESNGRKSPEKESGSKTSTEKKSDKDSAQNKTEEKDHKTSSKKESNSRKTPDKDSAQNKTEEKDLKTSSKTESNGRKSPDKESGSKTSTEKKSDKDSAQNKTEEKDHKTSSKKESNSRKTPDKESAQNKTEEKDLKTSSKKESNSRKSPDKESAQNKTEEKDHKTSSKTESNSRKTPDKESAQNKTEEKDLKTSSKKESSGRKSPEKESESKKSALKELSNLKPQEKPSQEESVTADKESLETNEEQMKMEKECDGRKSSDKESEKTSRSPDYESSEEEPSSGKTEEKNSVVLSSSTKGLEKQLLPGMSQDDKILKTPENDLVPDKTLKTDSDGESSQTEKENLETGEKHGPAEEGKQKSYEGQGVCSKEEPSESAVTNPDLVEQPIKQEAYNNRQLQDSEEAEEGPVPAWDAANPEKPTKPVGTEFVRPVVGYFCNLCQLIYADEDEAKLQHCSSLTHYRKYQEKTGKDPWSS